MENYMKNGIRPLLPDTVFLPLKGHLLSCLIHGRPTGR